MRRPPTSDVVQAKNKRLCLTMNRVTADNSLRRFNAIFRPESDTRVAAFPDASIPNSFRFHLVRSGAAREPWDRDAIRSRVGALPFPGRFWGVRYSFPGVPVRFSGRPSGPGIRSDSASRPRGAGNLQCPGASFVALLTATAIAALAGTSHSPSTWKN